MTVLGELHCVVLLCGLNISPCTICIRTVDRFLITHTLHYRCLFPSQVKGWCTIIALMMGASVGWGNLMMMKKKTRNHLRYRNCWTSGIKDILIKKAASTVTNIFVFFNHCKQDTSLIRTLTFPPRERISDTFYMYLCRI